MGDFSMQEIGNLPTKAAKKPGLLLVGIAALVGVWVFSNRSKTAYISGYPSIPEETYTGGGGSGGGGGGGTDPALLATLEQLATMQAMTLEGMAAVYVQSQDNIKAMQQQTQDLFYSMSLQNQDLWSKQSTALYDLQKQLTAREMETVSTKKTVTSAYDPAAVIESANIPTFTEKQAQSYFESQKTPSTMGGAKSWDEVDAMDRAFAAAVLAQAN